MLIVSGEVRSYYVSPSGREITLGYWTHRHFVGGPEVLGAGVHTWSGEAITACELLFYASKDLKKLILEIPRFALNVVEGITFKSKCFSSLLQLVSTRSSRALIAQLLIALAEQRQADGRDQLYVPATHTQDSLAKMVGSTRQWVTSSLKKMRSAGLIEVKLGEIVILKPNSLSLLAETEGATGDGN